MADKKLGDCKGLWKKIFIVTIIILVMVLFFVSTRDYEKFKILNREINEKLDPETGRVVEATKECNKLTNKDYKMGCYGGISYAVGYNNFENLSEICPKLTTPVACYSGAGKRLGEEFYNDTEYMLGICKIVQEENNAKLCGRYAMRSAGQMLAYHNKSWEYCKTVDEQYRNACYEGMSWGLCQQHYPALREKLISDCKSLGDYVTPCLNGIISAVSEYMAENPSYAEAFNEIIVESVQQNYIPESFLNTSSGNAGFYAGIKHFQDLETAFMICDMSYQGLNESLKQLCYENVYYGFGYACYSELFNKTLLK